MGNNANLYIKNFGQISNIQKLNDESYGIIKVAYKKQNNKSYAIYNVFQKDQHQHSLLYQQALYRKQYSYTKISNCFLLVPIQFVTKYSQNQNNCIQFPSLCVIYRFYRMSLRQQLIKRRVSKIKYREEQINTFIQNMDQAIRYAQKNNINLQFIEPCKIFNVFSEYYILDINWLKTQSRFKYSNKFNQCYLTPKQLYQLRYSIYSTQSLSDQKRFNVGIIALQMATLKNSIEFYNIKHFRLNNQKIMQSLKVVRNDYSNDLKKKIQKKIFCKISIDDNQYAQKKNNSFDNKTDLGITLLSKKKLDNTLDLFQYDDLRNKKGISLSSQSKYRLFNQLRQQNFLRQDQKNYQQQNDLFKRILQNQNYYRMKYNLEGFQNNLL